MKGDRCEGYPHLMENDLLEPGRKRKGKSATELYMLAITMEDMVA